MGADRAPQPRRILIARLGSMGDVIHTLPAAVVLRRAFPEAHLGWAIEPRWSALLRAGTSPASGRTIVPRSPQQPLVDEVHLVDTRGWRKSLTAPHTWNEIHAVARELSERSYDLVVDFQGAWKSAFLAVISRAPQRLGFSHPRERPASLFYTRAIPARGTHIVEQNISLAAALAPKVTTNPEFPLPHDPAAEETCAQEVQRRGTRQFAILNPGAGWGAKCWPAENYAAVARALAECGLPSLVNYGPGEEKLAQTLELASRGAAQPISCSLSELIALMRRASLFIGGDTGPLHLAAALHVPVVGIFGPTDPARNGPFRTPNVVLRSPLSPTTHARRAEADAALLSIRPEQVFAAAQQLLRETGVAHV